MKISRIRGWVVFALVVGLTTLSLAFNTGTGTLSALGVGHVAALCPVGALESFLGARQLTLHGVFCLGVTVLVTLAVGKAFCAWACPVPWLRRFFRLGSKQDCAVADEAPSKPAIANAQHIPLPPVGGKRDGYRIDGRHVVLGGALASSLAFGFPVFCLVCPVGLSFAALIALWRLVGLNETTWDLVVFSAILLVEVVLLRKWCTRLCPISALLSLISRANRTLRPHVGEACLRAHGKDCRACVQACPEQLDPHTKRIPECSKCNACAEACPAQAISLKLFGAKPRKTQVMGDAGSSDSSSTS